MTNRHLHLPLVLALTACGSAPSATQAQAAIGDKPFTTAEVATFDSPWAMDFLPGREAARSTLALVTETDGKLWLLDVTSGKKQQVAGVPKVHVEGQGGLADIVVHPQFALNHRIYLSFPEAGPNGTSGSSVGYGELVFGQGQPRLDNFKTIWRQQPKVKGGAHYSERIAFAPDGSLFITSGERFQFMPAQDVSNDLGKVLHMTDEGAPVAGSTAANPRLYSYGHRNLLGISFAPDGKLWEVEMGPMGGDELNLIQPGLNYGWPRASNGSNYDGSDIPDHRQGDGFEPPKVWWNPSISPGGLLIYTGDLFPQWKGDALIGALSGEAFIRVDIDGDTARKADQWGMGQRIRAVDQGPRGEVYLLEDGSNARLLRLEPRR